MFVALITQHAERVCLIILSSVACPGVQFFFTLPQKRHDFRRNVREHKMLILIFSTTFA
jgi:hypothetical protein